jgi:hypothetical protein
VKKKFGWRLIPFHVSHNPSQPHIARKFLYNSVGSNDSVIYQTIESNKGFVYLRTIGRFPAPQIPNKTA